MSGAPPPQPGTAGTDDDPLDIETDVLELLNNATGVATVENLVGVAADSTSTDGTLVYPTANGAQGVPTDLAVRIDGVDRPVTAIEYADATGTLRPVTQWHLGPLGEFTLTLDSLTFVQPATFDVAIVSATSPVAPGDTLDVTVELTNTGDETGTQTVTLSIDNSVGQVDSQSVTLSGGGSTTQTLSWSVPSGQTEQDYTATVASTDDTASRTVTVATAPSGGESYYKFESNLTDAWGNDTLTGSTSAGYVSGQSGQAKDFDGTDDYLRHPRIVCDDLPQSIALYFKWRNGPETAENFVGYQGSNEIYFRVDNFGTDTAISLETFDGDTHGANATGVVNENQVYHAVGTLADAGGGDVRYTIYLDGSQVAQTTTVFPAPSGRWFIGSQLSTKRFFDGWIDELKFYSKELTSTEVSNLYNNGRI